MAQSAHVRRHLDDLEASGYVRPQRAPGRPSHVVRARPARARAGSQYLELDDRHLAEHGTGPTLLTWRADCAADQAATLLVATRQNPARRRAQPPRDLPKKNRRRAIENDQGKPGRARPTARRARAGRGRRGHVKRRTRCAPTTTETRGRPVTEPELPVDAGVLLFPLTIDRRSLVLELEVDGDPVPWARAGRSARGRAYTPRRQADWAEHVGWAMREAYQRAAARGRARRMADVSPANPPARRRRQSLQGRARRRHGHSVGRRRRDNAAARARADRRRGARPRARRVPARAAGRYPRGADRPMMLPLWQS